ncbi:MAG: hypothetical protein ACKOUT_11235 [Novosphingobium sp.]
MYGLSIFAATLAIAPYPPAEIETPDFSWSDYSISPQPVSPTKPAVTDLGTLQFTPDLAEYSEFLDAQYPSAWRQLSMQFSGDGKLINCASPDDALFLYQPGNFGFSRKVANKFCEEAGRKARWVPAAGHPQKNERVSLDVWMHFKSRVELVFPVRFRSKGKGKQVILKFGAQGRCRIPDIIIMPAHEQAVCRALAQNARATALGRQVTPRARHGLQVVVWIDARKATISPVASLEYQLRGLAGPLIELQADPD